MSYPIIILGAGASHDYIPKDILERTPEKKIYQPPLTDDLLHPDKFNKIVGARFTFANELATDIRQYVKPNGKTLEQRMLEILGMAKENNIDRQKQVVSFRFFLQKLFEKISLECSGQIGNNYGALKVKVRDYIHKWQAEDVSIVTFNYDTILESALGIGSNLNSYVKNENKINLIKLHGSCDWRYLLSPDIDTNSSHDFLLENPLYAIEDQRRQLFFDRTVQEFIYRQDTKYHSYPAIALPLGDIKTYVCPDAHVNILKKRLEKTDRIMIIGWRAGDPYFIDLLMQTKQPIDVYIISLTRESASEVKKKLSHILNLKINVFDGGFSGAMSNGTIDSFFLKDK